MSTESRPIAAEGAAPHASTQLAPRGAATGGVVPAAVDERSAPQQPSFMLVMPPRRVQVVKEFVEGARRKAPWLFVAAAPIKPLFSGLYYGWINRHERVPVPPPGPSMADAPSPGPRTSPAPSVAQPHIQTQTHTRADGPVATGQVEPGGGPPSVPSCNAGTALGEPASVAALPVAAGSAVVEAEIAPARRAGSCAAPCLGQPLAMDEGAADRSDEVVLDATADEEADSGAVPPPADVTTINGAHVEPDARRLPLVARSSAEPAPEPAPEPEPEPEPGPMGADDRRPQVPTRSDGDGAARPKPPVETPASAAGAAVALAAAATASVAPRARRVPPAPSPAERFEEQVERARRLSDRRVKWAGRAERVSMVIGTLGPGGAERQLVTLATELRRRGRGMCRAITIREPVGNDGHHVENLAANARLERTTPMDIAAAYECLEREGLGFLRQVLAPELFWDIPPLMRMFRATQPSVVHAWLDWSSLVAGFAAILLPVRRVLLSTRNVAPRNFPSLDRPYLRDMYRLLLRDPRVRIINNSSAGADDYAAWLGLRRSQIRVVRNGVDMGTIRNPGPQAVEALRAELGLDRSARLVAGVFRLAEEKQPDTFIDVAERILAAEPSTVVVHAGSGELEGQMQQRVAASPHAARIRLLGRRHDVPTILSAADLCLLTSRKEGTPNVLIEAQVLGCPVVATRAGGAPETFEHQRTGFLCEVGDAEGMAAAALRLLADDALRRSMAEAAQAFATGRFSVRRMADETIELYD